MEAALQLPAGNGGANAPITPPENYQALTYENKWDPELVLPAAHNIRHCSTRGLPQLAVEQVRRGKMIICGSSPSLLDHIDEIREFKRDGRNKVFAVNRAHGILRENGVMSDGALVFEIARRAYEFLEGPQEQCNYYVCSICDPYAFDMLKNNKVTIWHCWSDIWVHVKALNDSFGTISPTGQVQSPMLVGGGFTTFLRTLSVGYILGFRDFELFGVDSSFEGEHSHFFGTPDYGGDIMDCYARTLPETPDNPRGLKQYKSKAYLIRQADEFKQFCEAWGKDYKMRVWGKGLLPDMHRYMFPRMYGDQ